MKWKDMFNKSVTSMMDMLLVMRVNGIVGCLDNQRACLMKGFILTFGEGYFKGFCYIKRGLLHLCMMYVAIKV